MHKISFKQKEKVEKYFSKGKKNDKEKKLNQKEKRIEITKLKKFEPSFSRSGNNEKPLINKPVCRK